MGVINKEVVQPHQSVATLVRKVHEPMFVNFELHCDLKYGSNDNLNMRAITSMKIRVYFVKQNFQCDHLDDCEMMAPVDNYTQRQETSFGS